MEKQRKIKRTRIRSYKTIEEAFRNCSSFLDVPLPQDFTLTAKRLKEIASLSYKYSNFEQKFRYMKPAEQINSLHSLSRIYNVVYNPINFKKEYESLSSDEKYMALMQMLKIYHYGDKSREHTNLSADEQKFYWYKIRKAMTLSSITVDHKIHSSIEPECKRVIRWDSYGLLEKPEPSKLSPEYHEFRQSDKSLMAPRNSKKYDLFDSPAWTYKFAQFATFAQHESDVQEALSAAKVPPSLLPHLNIYDYADILYNYEGNPKYGTAKIFSGSKFEFVKIISRIYEKEIAQAHKEMGIDERYTRSLIREMKRFGVSANITPLEFICRHSHIEQFKSRGIDCSSLEVGQEYPEKFYDFLFATKNYDILLAKDEFGNPVKGPEYDVDHKDTVDDAGEKSIEEYNIPNIQATNSLTKYRLVEKNIHQLLIHAKDKIMQTSKNEAYISRVRLKDENVVIMFGVDPSSWISRDMSQEPYVIRQNNYFQQVYLPKLKQLSVLGLFRENVKNEEETPNQKSKSFIRTKNKRTDKYSDIFTKAIKANRRGDK